VGSRAKVDNATSPAVIELRQNLRNITNRFGRRKVEAGVTELEMAYEREALRFRIKQDLGNCSSVKQLRRAAVIASNFVEADTCRDEAAASEAQAACRASDETDMRRASMAAAFVLFDSPGVANATRRTMSSPSKLRRGRGAFAMSQKEAAIVLCSELKRRFSALQALHPATLPSESCSSESLHGTPREVEVQQPITPIDDLPSEHSQEVPTEGALDAASEVAREARWTAVFQRLSSDEEVHRDSLAIALDFTGLRCVDALLAEAVTEVTPYNTLDAAEFRKFLQCYDAKQFAAFSKAFAELDPYERGWIDTSEVPALIERTEVTPFTPIRQVTRELIAEIDRKRTQQITLGQLRTLLEILRIREGFSRRDEKRLQEAFRKVNHRKQAVLSLQDIHLAFGWLGYSLSLQDIDKLCLDIHNGAHRDLSQVEWLICARKVREIELQHIRDLVVAADANESGSIDSVKEMESLLRALGYRPDRQAVRDAAEDAGVLVPSIDDLGGNGRRPSISSERDFELDFWDVWRFVEVYRAHEGFNRKDVADIDEAFRRYDRDGKGELSTLEVGKVLRWLGYPTSWEQQQHLLAEVDVDKSGKLNIRELRKLMRKYRDREMAKTLKAFQDRDEAGSGQLSEAQTRFALRDVDLDMDEVERHGLPGSPKATCRRSLKHYMSCIGSFTDLEEFLEIANQIRIQQRVAFRHSAGYSPEEVVKMRDVFLKYDADKSGTISNHESRKVITDLFPEFATSAKMRPLLTRLINEVDENGDGEFDFPDFLRMMRQFQELREKDRLEKETKAVQESKFDSDEVEEFRVLFIGEEEDRTELGFSDFRQMIIRCCTSLKEAETAQLQTIFKEIIGGDGQGKADFPEFLRLMRKVLDVDFANIQEQSQRVVEQAEKRRNKAMKTIELVESLRRPSIES